jgi:hypothetical protein
MFLSALLVVVVVIVGRFVLAPLTFVIVILPVIAVLRHVNRLLAYMASRYLGFAFDVVVLAGIVAWAGAALSLITWPAWIAAGWFILSIGRTLIFWDIQCYVRRTGAWARTQSLPADEA